MNDGRQVGPLQKLKNDMNVVWHHTPRMKPVPSTVEISQSFCNEFRNLRYPQVARPGARIQNLLNSTRHCLGKVLPSYGRLPDLHGLPLKDLTACSFKGYQFFLRHRIR